MSPVARGISVLAVLVAAAGPAGAQGAPVPHYVVDPARSTLEFTFTQAGAENRGKFKRFPVSFDFAPASPASGRLEVTVEIASLDTGDQERDDTLRGAELFAAAKFPQAHFLATQFTKTASGFEAVGKLTIRGVTRELHVPFTFRTADEHGTQAAYMNGKTTIRRLDFGVGQGDWRATDQVGDEVGVTFALRLTPAAR